ncbi:MAG: hypothetical protein WAO91_10095 [Candidatus Nitrosotenuis sp.]
MKTVLAFALMAIVASMVVGTPLALADAKLDSLVNIAVQARSQIKLQLDKMPSISDETRSLYDQGNAETELLISAARQGDVAQAKQHFMSAMKTFRQISLTFSEQAQPQVALKQTPPPVTPAPREIDYENSIKRIEAFTNKLKGQTAKNGIVVDFTRIDSLIQLSKTSLADGDRPALEKAFAELKIAIMDTQNAIKETIAQRANDRAREFANSYITKIDTVLARANDLGLSDEDISKLIKAKEEILSANDPNQIIIIIKRYSVNLSVYEAQRSQQKAAPPVPEKVETEEQRTAPPPAQEKVETEEQRPTPEAVAPVERPPSDSGEEQANQDTKNQRESAELARFEAKLAEIQPYVDENIKPKFERAESLLSKLQNQETVSNSDYKRTVRMLNLLLDQMERYVKSLQSGETDSNQDLKEQTRNRDSEEKHPPKQNR